MSYRIALFDMDGVLLESLGYHIALQETVRQAALELGLNDPPLSMEAIASFEAGGITCEWDEAAICHAVMLKWPAGRPGLKEAIEATARRLGEADLLPLAPLERAEKLLVEMEPGLSAASGNPAGAAPGAPA